VVSFRLGSIRVWTDSKDSLDGDGCECSIVDRDELRSDVCSFVIDGIITLPVAVYGFLLFPDTPRNTTAPYLSADEKALAISRVPEVSERTPISWRFLKHCFGTWYWYMFVVLWILAGETESFSTNALLQLYMKSHPTNKYTIAQVNNYPTGVPAVGIVSTLFWATLTDFMGGKRYLGRLTTFAP
jgi:ACS family pantothenate transporter-like MFS transporter